MLWTTHDKAGPLLFVFLNTLDTMYVCNAGIDVTPRKRVQDWRLRRINEEPRNMILHTYIDDPRSSDLLVTNQGP